jgi:murein tripeptide amidase MpaA
MFPRLLSLLFLLSLAFYVCAGSVEDISKINNHCDKISTKLASVNYKECLSHKFEKTGAYSVKGSPIIVKRINAGSDTNEVVDATQHRVLIIGGFHGDEYSTVSIIFKWITLINLYYTGSNHWQIIPLLNPDGLLQRSSRRTNTNGVDLDRNFPVTANDENAIQYWEENTNRDPEYFPGKDALSEPESQWLAEEIKRYRPDAIITIHAPNHSLGYKSSNIAQSKNAAQYQQSIATYPGSFNQYAGTEINIPILTVELPYADIMPTNSEINAIWKNILKWLNTNIESS